MDTNKGLKKDFTKYVSQNILANLGISCYALADTIFISMYEGSKGITAINLVLPLYNLIYAIGALIAEGSAIRFAITKVKDIKKAETYYGNAVFFAFVFGALIGLWGIFKAGGILTFLGADETIKAIGTGYTRIFMAFAPIFMINQITNAFVRNDNAPTIAMIATLASNIFNIVFDYILMFPLGLGMEGAALATAFSPIVGMLILLIHLLAKDNQVKIVAVLPSIKKLIHSAGLGISGFVGEVSGGVMTLSMNYIFMGLGGNLAVAAYGIVANIAIFTTATFNGLAHGVQPLLSHEYAKGDKPGVSWLKRTAFITSLVIALILYLSLSLNTGFWVGIFNSEGSKELLNLASKGIKLYFLTVFFTGLNIVGSSYFSATANGRGAFAVSILRGFVLILLFAFLLSFLFGMDGLWLASTLAEGVTALVMLLFLIKEKGSAS